MRKKIITGIAIVSIISSSIFLTRANLGVSAGLPEGIYPHPSDCRMFFKITENGNEIKFECAEGTAYDVFLKTCVGIDSARNPAPPCNTTQ